jgi:predicted enzyme related to lactoylglutathione lyase
MAGSFIWYELMTPDPAGAAAFYGAVAGWTVTAPIPGDEDYRMILRSDGGHAGAIKRHDHSPAPVWLAYLHTKDVDAACKTLEQLGGIVSKQPWTIPGAGRMAVVSDPWGAAFYLMAPTPPPGQPDAVSDVFADKPQHMRWNQHWSPDAKAAATFYGDLVGWRQDGAMPMPDGRSYLFVHAGDVAIGAMGDMLPEGRGPRWEFILGVDDIDRAVAAAIANGGTVDGKVNQVPGGDWSASVIDPQGARIGLVGPRKES